MLSMYDDTRVHSISCDCQLSLTVPISCETFTNLSFCFSICPQLDSVFRANFKLIPKSIINKQGKQLIFTAPFSSAHQQQAGFILHFHHTFSVRPNKYCIIIIIHHHDLLHYSVYYFSDIFPFSCIQHLIIILFHYRTMTLLFFYYSVIMYSVFRLCLG